MGQSSNRTIGSGHFHPLTVFIQEAVQIFKDLGFVIAEGPELETEWFNFDFLRVPSDHPARDEQDTFWIGDKVLRTHMTTVQGRIMKKVSPPCRFVMPGRVFRNEATDATHESILHQLDGFAIAKNITMADLIGTLEHFLKKILSTEIKIHLRPHHYPFVEPGMDVAIKISNLKSQISKWQSEDQEISNLKSPRKLSQEGKQISGNQWLEVLGSGMIHPLVLKNMGVDPQKWQGFAFGMGLERLMMLKYGIADIRAFLKNDMRMNRQF